MHLRKIKLNKKLLFFSAIIALVCLEVFWFLFLGGGSAFISSYLNKNTERISGIILFEGKDCEHCAKVDVFIENNNVQDKVAFTTLEVFNNSNNANILADKARICGLDQDHIGVPFLWDGKNCVVGYVDVIKFFQDAIRPKKP